MRFGALYFQNGGCDYSIGCGYRFVEMPEDVSNLQQAYEWLSSGDDVDESMACFGGDIDSVRIMLFRDCGTLTPEEIRTKCNQPKVDLAKEHRRHRYEQLKEEFKKLKEEFE